MKTRNKSIYYAVLLAISAFFSVAYADLNVGKGKVSSSEIINEFSTKIPKGEENTIDLQNEKTRDMLCKPRGLSANCETSNSTPVNNSKGRKPPKLNKQIKTTSAKNNIRDHKSVSKQPYCDQKSVTMEIMFEYKSDQLTNSAIEQLKPLGEALASEQLRGFSYLIQGHTDIIGSYAYNKDLSLRRAISVKQYLTNNFDFKGKSIDVEGKGKSELADPLNPTSEKNRRVKIIKLGC
jgi:outer membrane protein OmpA-like peptidoglycan-associated protein